ncbi:MAG TPA: hypothetical protein VGK18_12640 [Propionicimonas sp.]|jgi:hypothetical protein|uniref:hypothetical protein n=1 Tax=Propionicimonas sp. TaxID=1955623 RepID=UPI002F3EF8BA
MQSGADEGTSAAPGERGWLGFGVLRERDGGEGVDFDLILDLGSVPASGVVTRTYRAGHNLGWYRFVGYTALGPNGQPVGDLIPLADVRFPFDPFLQGRYRLDGIAVERWGYGPVIEESYAVEVGGLASVRITDTETGYSQVYGLG